MGKHLLIFRHKLYTYIMLVICCILIDSCAYSKKSAQQKQFEIKYQEKTWLLKVLDVTSFSNGVPIPEAKTREEWIMGGVEKKPAWTYFNNDKEHGKLYNWYAITSPNGLAPSGWHIPSDGE